MAKEESKVVERIKEEAARIGESTIYSSKSHFNMAPKWKNWHYLLGIVSIVLSVSVTSGRAIFPDVPIDVVGGVLLTLVTTIIAFIKPEDTNACEVRVGNDYKEIHNRARRLYEIKSLLLSEDALLEELDKLATEKSLLDKGSSQPSEKAYLKAKEGIEAGQADFRVDEGKETPWWYGKKSKS